MNDSLSYVVMHPERPVFKVSSLVLRAGARKPERRTLKVLADAIEENHDPCVLTEPWFYSFCHASQMKRSQMGPGSVIFFYDYRRRSFDTVFSVRAKHEWSRPHPARLCTPIPVKLSTSMEKLAWDLHFKWPSKWVHRNTMLTFEAKIYPEDGYSFLPIGDGGPVSLESLSLPWLERRIREYDSGKWPVPLSGRQAGQVLRAIDREADAKVIGGLRLLDPRDVAKIGQPRETPSGTQRRHRCG